MNDLRVPARHPQRVAPQEQETHQPTHPTNRRRGGLPLLPALIAVFALALIAGLIYWFMPTTQAINSTGYQVVYLTSGQAYFGKLKNVGGDYLVIDTLYTAQDVKSSDDKSANPQTTLIKVSNQLYGPTDSIAIRASEVSFWQNLRDDSKVVQAIKSKQ